MEKKQAKLECLIDTAIVFADLKMMRKAQKAKLGVRNLAVNEKQITHVCAFRDTLTGLVFVRAPSFFKSIDDFHKAGKAWIKSGKKMEWMHLPVEGGDPNNMSDCECFVEYSFAKRHGNVKTKFDQINMINDAISFKNN